MSVIYSRPGCIQLESSAVSNYQIYYLWAEPSEEIQKWKEWLKPYCKNTKNASRHNLSRRGVREIYTMVIKVVEGKNLAERLPPGPVYCQINLNDVPVAKTQPKELSSPVWDEDFLITDMPTNVEHCSVILCSKMKKSGSKDQELYQITKTISELKAVKDMDEWLNMSILQPTHTNDINIPPPCIRLKIRYKHDVILPLHDYRDIQTVLLSKDCQIVSTLGLLCDNLSDRITLAQALLKVFRHDNKEATLLKTLTSVEIADEENAATLFRSTSLATTLMDQYMKLTAAEFVKSALQKTVLKITESNIKVELDPNILDNSSGLDANKGMLMQLLNDLLAAIVNAKNDCPAMLRHICGCLQRNVAKRWPDNEIVKPRVVSGFIFLRLLCPAIVNPRLFNLVQDTPLEPASRTLKLVAKSLNNLANLVEVGTKELYMEAIGPFIIDNKPRMVAFLNELADMPEMPETDRGMPIPEDIAQELSTIHKICSAHMKSLQTRSSTQPALKKLVAALHALDMTKVSYFDH